MISYFVRHPVAANLLMVIVCLLGVSVTAQLKRETFPAFSTSSVSISIGYPGASAIDVDENICAPLETALTSVVGLTQLDCLSTEGSASATAELEENGDTAQFFNDVFSTVSRISDFPSTAETPVVEAIADSDFLAKVAVSGIATQTGLVEYTNEFANRILDIDGVVSATVSGISTREVRVSFNEESLRRYGLSGQDVVNAVTTRSFSQPLGFAQLANENLSLRYTDTRRSAAELEEVIILQSEGGGFLRLGDVADVTTTSADENIGSFVDGQPAAIITITKTAAADSIRVYQAVEALLNTERQAYADPFTLTVINNTVVEIRDRLTLILKNIGYGLTLVFITMWLFFSLREALWISAALPVSFLGTLFVMQMSGLSINMITLIGLLMSVGLIMDDSIVISENISKWRRRAGPLEAATRGTLEVLPGVLSSFLTTACVFGPLIFISGEFGQILRMIPLTLLITLAVSILEGILILPHHLSSVSSQASEQQKIHGPTRALEWCRDRVVMPITTRLTHLRYLTLGTTLALLLLSVGLITSGTVRIVGFGEEEGNTIEARIALSSGIARERTVATVESLLTALEDVDATYTPLTTGQAPIIERVLVEYGANADVNDNGSNTATVTVDLLDVSLRNVRANEVLQTWREAIGPIPDLVQSSFSQSEDGPGGQAIDVELRGRNLVDLEAAATDLMIALNQRDDVRGAYQDFYGGRGEIQVVLNKYGYTTGLTPQVLSEQLRNSFQGAETDFFYVGETRMTVRVQLDDASTNLTGIEQFPVSLPNGDQVALSGVADLEITTGYPTITRRDGLALARVLGTIDASATTSSDISAVVINELGPHVTARYPGIEIGIGGETEELEEGQSSIVRLMLTGLFGVYSVLAFQFRSYSLPILVMCAIPFALIGSISGHALMGMDMSVPSMIGFASLAGIVVNNTILFLTFFQTHLEDGNYVAASLSAVRNRFRPVLLSTMTTFVGLLPIIFDTSPEVATLVPLVVSVAFGLLASMALVLMVFPSLLSIYFDIANVRNWARKFEAEIEVNERNERSRSEKPHNKSNKNLKEREECFT